MEWEVVDTGIGLPEHIMAYDAEGLESLGDRTHPLLHLYTFLEPSATYGYFLRPDTLFRMDRVAAHGLQLARRPTGGGVIFHVWDLAFSVLIPATHPQFSANTLENYALVNRPVLRAVESFLSQNGLELTPDDGTIIGAGCEHFCMAKPTRYDVVWKGKKIAGAAQRKTRHGLLHQGSISLMLPDFQLVADLLQPGLAVVEGMQAFTYPLLGKECDIARRDEGRKELQEKLCSYLTLI